MIDNPAMTTALTALEIEGLSDKQMTVAARHLGAMYLQGIDDGKKESLPTAQ